MIDSLWANVVETSVFSEYSKMYTLGKKNRIVFRFQYIYIYIYSVKI